MINVNMTDKAGVTLATAGKYCADNVKVTPSADILRKDEQAKTATPTTSAQDITPDAGKALSKVTVNPITAAIVGNLDASNFAASIVAAVEGKGVTVPDGTLLDGMAALVESIEAGGGTISGKKFISGEITFSETPTSEITISHDSVGFISQPFVFLAGTASVPADHTGALISVRSGSGVYVNNSNRVSALTSISDTLDFSGYANDTSFTIGTKSATKMLAGKTYIWVRIEL